MSMRQHSRKETEPDRNTHAIGRKFGSSAEWKKKKSKRQTIEEKGKERRVHPHNLCGSGRIMIWDYESWPNQPRASTREHAVVGVGGTPRVTNERVRPWRCSVATRGEATVGKGICCRFDMSVMVLGVRDGVDMSCGEGGKTNSVCDGPEDGGTAPRVCWFVNVRRNKGGGVGCEDLVRVRRGGGTAS
jgi:hypothetical protein